MPWVRQTNLMRNTLSVVGLLGLALIPQTSKAQTPEAHLKQETPEEKSGRLEGIPSSVEKDSCIENGLKVLNPTESKKENIQRIPSRSRADLYDMRFTDGPFVNEMELACVDNKDRLDAFDACLKSLHKKIGLPKPKEQNFAKNLAAAVAQEQFKMRNEMILSQCRFGGRGKVTYADFQKCFVALASQSPLDTGTISTYCNNSFDEKTLATYLEQVTRETELIEARNKLNELVPEMKRAPMPEVFLGPDTTPPSPKP